MVISLGRSFHLGGHLAVGRRRAVWHACSVLPSLVVPGLVGPFTSVVIAADACLDACVRAGEGRRGGRRPVGSRTSGVVGSLRAAAVGAAAVVG